MEHQVQLRVEISADSIDALTREAGLNTLEALHRNIETFMPHTTFECKRLWVGANDDNTDTVSFVANFNRWRVWHKQGLLGL